MFFAFSFKSSILLFFFLHGIIFSSLLLIKGFQTNNKSSFWLGFFVLLCSLYIAPFMFGYAGWYSKESYRNFLFYVPFQQLFLLGPVLYFYFKSLLDKSFRITKKDYVHFLPAALYLIYSLAIFLIDTYSGTYYLYADGKDKDFSVWYQVTGLVSLSYYLFQSLRVYTRYKTLTYNSVSFAESVMFKWAQRFLVAFLMLIAIRILFFVVNPEWDQFGKKFWYYVCFSILFYFISISGYTNSILSITSFADAQTEEETVVTNFADEAAEIENNSSLLAEEEPRKTEIEIPELSIWKEKVEALMLQDKMYENPELVISNLSQRLNTHSKKISQIINQGFNMNFNDFVNHYRIKALIKKIEEGEHTVQTLLGIAFDCGFNSKSTFNRAFKRYTTLSPKEYIEKNTL